MQESAEARLGRIEAVLERLTGIVERGLTQANDASRACDGAALSARRLGEDIAALQQAFLKAVDSIAQKATEAQKAIGDAQTAAQHIRGAQGAALQIAEHLARGAKVAQGIGEMVAASRSALARVTELADSIALSQEKAPRSIGEEFLESGRNGGD